MMQRVATVALASCLLTAWALGQSARQPGGSIQGVVFTTEQVHARSVMPVHEALAKRSIAPGS